MKLETCDQRIPPVRSLVPLQNARGRPFDALTLKRWLRLNRTVHKMHKVDLLVQGQAAQQPDAVLADLLAYAASLDLRVSLRTDCAAPRVGLAALREAGLFDVFLCPPEPNDAGFREWLHAARDASLPIRVQFQAPFPSDLDVDALADDVAAAGVNAVNVALSDPFSKRPGCRDATEAQATVAAMNALASALVARGVEANIVGLPLCLASEDNRVRTLNSLQFVMDHQQYAKQPYEFAQAMFARRPFVVAKIVLLLLARHMSTYTPIDDAVLNLLMYKRQWWFARVVAWHKLTRHLRLFWQVAKRRKDETDQERFEREAAEMRKTRRKTLSPVCAKCALEAICDHETKDFGRLLPGVAVEAQEGEAVRWPLSLSVRQPKYYDAIDAARRALDEDSEALSNKANEIVRTRPPDRELDSHEYSVKDSYFVQMPGGVRWFSVSNVEKLSWPLMTLETPFTLSVTFGGGIAEYVGFAFGRHSRLVCPMETHNHKLVLHVEADGRYVLLRDGAPVRPVEFEGAHYVPLRLGSVLMPQISIWNINHEMITQAVLFWFGDKAPAPKREGVKYTVVLVCTRYARRLEATLRSIAHQQGVAPGEIEVVVGYVPGLDATDDVLDSVEATFPELRIVRSPFPADTTHAKGFMINESVRSAAGDWVVLLDADIILAPQLFAELGKLPDECRFAAPDGRKMLTHETTGKILLGEIEPWNAWDDLLKGPGEFRLREAYGVPIGYCQCVRKECFETVQQNEYGHFEGADWQFGVDMRNAFGKEHRLSGVPVLHLDHGGSHWYGTRKHL